MTQSDDLCARALHVDPSDDVIGLPWKVPRLAERAQLLGETSEPSWSIAAIASPVQDADSTTSSAAQKLIFQCIPVSLAMADSLWALHSPTQKILTSAAIACVGVMVNTRPAAQNEMGLTPT